MKKRRLFIFVCLYCLALVSFYVCFWLTAPRHQITEESFARIQKGMTEKEVEIILGIPAGNYETNKQKLFPMGDLFTPKVPCAVKEWEGNGLIITIWFDAQGKVHYSRIGGWCRETFFDKLRRLLHM